MVYVALSNGTLLFGNQPMAPTGSLTTVAPYVASGIQPSDEPSGSVKGCWMPL